MLFRQYYIAIVVFLFITANPGFSYAGEPTDKIKQTTDKILSIVSDKSLKDDTLASKRKKMISMAVGESFDWEEMSRRSLARYWRKRTKEEKEEFISLFSQLLERTYLAKVEGYSGEKVEYAGESVKNGYSTVNVKIVTDEGKEIAVDYRLMKKENNWLVYDISIGGVSLVNNYRTQFNNIITRSSYKALLKRLKEKVKQ